MRIKILIRNNDKFSDVALFVDKPDVLREILNLRKEWIDDALINNNEIDDFLNIDRNSAEARKHWDCYTKAVKTLKVLGYGATYVAPFFSAILSGVVSEKDYSTVIKEPPFYNLPEDLQLDNSIVYTSKRISKQDLPAIKGKRDTKAISTIKRDREWYWLHKTIGHRKIAKKYNLDRFTVHSAIVSYEKRLK